MPFMKGGRWLTSVLLLATLPLVLVSPVHPLQASAKSYEAPQPAYSGIAWQNEPLDRVFGEVQQRFIGVVPGNYSEPASADYSTMRTVFSLIESSLTKDNPNTIPTAATLAREVDYQLMPINDSATGHKFFILVEDQDLNRGWGSYFFAAEPNNMPTRVNIEAPHPVTDFNSQNIAYEIFIRSYPLVQAFFVSGVERTLGPNGQTDVAHKSLSIFETATESCTITGSVVLQIHSFDPTRPQHLGYPLVVLSAGDGGTNGALESIAANLRASGLSVGTFDGFKYESLGAADNVQGRYARSVLAGFVHAELSLTAVYNSTLVSAFQGSVIKAVTEGFRFPGYQTDLRIPMVTFSIVAIFVFAGYRFPKLGLHRQGEN
jgi:hypothetical protein